MSKNNLRSLLIDRSIYYVFAVGIVGIPAAAVAAPLAVSAGTEGLMTVGRFAVQGSKFFGRDFLTETAKELAANRGNLGEVDWFDVATGTLASKFKFGWKLKLGIEGF